MIGKKHRSRDFNREASGDIPLTYQYALARIISETELLPAKAGRFGENRGYGLKSFAHDLVTHKSLPPLLGSSPSWRPICGTVAPPVAMCCDQAQHCDA